MAKKPLSDFGTGDLVNVAGDVGIVLYPNTRIYAVQLSYNGHGWTTNEINAERIAKASEYRIALVEKGVIPGDMGKIYSRDALRKVLESGGELPADSVGGSGNGGRGRVHHCSCPDCPSRKILI